MKLVQKLTLMFILSTSAVLGVNGCLRVRREVGLFESDRVRDHDLMAGVLARAAARVLKADGPARAVEMITELGRRTDKLKIRWRPFTPGNELDARLERLEAGQTLSITDIETGAGQGRCTYATLPTDAAPPGAISLCESFASQQAYLHKTIVETVLTTATLAGVCALLSAILGVWLVGKPIAALSAAARKIGAGDFSSRLHLHQNDELSALADDVNAMSERLAAAAERVERETAQRLTAVEQLRHADRLTTVGKLASGLAHELGTPLNVIEARAQMIASGETSPAEAVDYARVIREASERMTRLIRQLLDFARPRKASPAAARIVGLVQKTANMLAPTAERQQIRLTVTDGPDDPVAVVDAEQLQQVLANLIVNAIQATDHPATIVLSVSQPRATPPADHGAPTGEYVCVTVRDEGSGIRQADISRIFEPFFTTKDVGSGTGLGLAVAYGIMRDHGGWIEVESDLGKGSVFRVFLPKAAAA